MIRDTNYYFFTRKFTSYTENYNEKLRKHGPYKMNLWMRETKVISIPPSKTSPLLYTLVLILEVRNQFCLPIPSDFFAF